MGDLSGAPVSTSNFSTGNDSPVSEPWITKRSLARDDSHVRRNHVPGGQLDDVARHELRDGQLLRLARRAGPSP